jgi:hypothetical protein
VVLEEALLVDRDGAERDGAERDGAERDGAERDGAGRERAAAAEVCQGGLAQAGVAGAVTGLEERHPAVPAVALSGGVKVAVGAPRVIPAVSGAPSHGGWGAIRSRAGTPSVSSCMPIGEPCGR